MGFLFDTLGSLSGYILWFFFDAVSNYGIAITIFVILFNVLMFPFAIKRQKSMAKSSKMNVKLQELKKKYEKNPKKYNEEMAKLYEKEGFNPTSGCLFMFLPLLLWSGIYGAITKPLQNVLHIPNEKVVAAVQVLPESESKSNQGYEQLKLVQHFSELKDKLTMLNEKEYSQLEEYSNGFNFLGLNLLRSPNKSEFSAMLWIVPVFCFLSSAFTAFISQKTMQNPVQNQGCMKYMPYAVMLIPVYWSYIIPAAVGIYWIVNSLFAAFQSVILNKFYNTYTINAQEEAARVARLLEEESKVEKI